MLDRRQPFGTIVGKSSTGARFSQGGNYYALDGSYVYSADNVAAPPGATRRTMADAKAAFAARASKKPAVTAPAPVPAAAPVAATDPPAPNVVPPEAQARPVVEQAEGLTREQQLMQLNYQALSALVRKAGGTPEKGSGAKQKMVKFLLENTSE